MADRPALVGERATRTRNQLLATSKQLFLELGYGGTRIEHITDACGISRAGFYTYFPSKRDVFLALGTDTYRAAREVVERFSALPRDCNARDIETWVREYFAFMDEHGAFMLGAAQAGPDDEDLKSTVRRVHPRAARRLGQLIRDHQSRPHGDETAMGLTLMAMLDRSWYFCHGARYPVDEEALIATLVEMIAALLGVALTPKEVTA